MSVDYKNRGPRDFGRLRLREGLHTPAHSPCSGEPPLTTSEYFDSSIGFEQKDLVSLIPQVRAFARFLSRDVARADDLTQDSLASALKSRGSFAAGTNLKAWLFTIVRNQFYDQKR